MDNGIASIVNIINKNDNSDHNTPGYSSLKSTDNDSISFRFPYENNMRIYFHMIDFIQLNKNLNFKCVARRDASDLFFSLNFRSVARRDVMTCFYH